ncbi:unnamed protein product, partial [Larinioides sclopetarius]
MVLGYRVHILQVHLRQLLLLKLRVHQVHWVLGFQVRIFQGQMV